MTSGRLYSAVTKHWRRKMAVTRFTNPMAIVLMCVLGAVESEAQVAVEVSYGMDRDVASGQANRDGWMNGTVEWMFPSGLGLGIGADFQFEGTTLNGGAAYLSSSFEYPAGIVAPFVRGGIGLGRAPCRGDTCTDGAHLRGSGGFRIRLSEEVRLSGEIGISRVSRPFGGAGISYRF